MASEVHSDRSDAEIIAASLDHPTEFGIIFARHHARVYTYAARRIGIGEAGDVASEVFLKAFRLRYRYDHTRPNSLPWLFGIAQNTIGDGLRSIRRRQRVYLYFHRDVSAPGTELADDRLVAEAVTDRLNAELGKLSKGDRDALLLFALEGLTYSEIGVTLGIPTGTVGSRISRARRKIGQAIPDLEQIAARMHNPDEVDDA